MAQDVAIRCAHYGNADLNPKTMKEGYKKDGPVFTFAMLFNDHVFYTGSLRKLVEDEYLHGDLIWRYRKRCAQFHIEWPDFDPQPLAESLREMKPHGCGENVGPPDQETFRRLKLLDRKITFMSGIMIGAVVVAVWVFVYSAIFWPLDRLLGSGWGGASGVVAIVCASIAGGIARRSVDRAYRGNKQKLDLT